MVGAALPSWLLGTFISTLIFGAVFYALLSFGWPPLHQPHPSLPAPPHFLHLMFVTAWTCVAFALAVNRVIFRRRSEFELGTREAGRNVCATLKA